MRRFLLFVVLVVLGVGLIAPGAAASGKPTKERYASSGFYTSWRQREPISTDAYYRITWYVSMYQSQEGQRKFFSAYVSRYVSKCTVESGGHTRCHTVSRLFGVRRDPASVEFNVENDLSAASLSGAFRLRDRQNGEVVEVKHVQISASLTAVGEVYRSRSSYTNWDGNCPESRYRFEYQRTRALADVTVTGDFQITQTGSKRGSIFEENGFVKRRKCD
jgi:hypothetical protein